MGEAERPLHELSPTERFTDRAAAYARGRPTYPGAAIDAVLEGLGEPSRLVAADVGAGTGIASRLLAGRGVRVVAVEPNEGMRRAAEPHPLVTWSGATAEATGLGTATVDLVLCAQAFHWFRAAEALAEFRRVLRKAGRLALVWNDRDEGDAFTRGYGEAIERHATIPSLARRHLASDAVLGAGAPFRDVRRLVFPWRQEMVFEGLLDRVRSVSYAPAAGAGLAALARELRDLHARHADAGGRVRLVYETTVWLADPA